MQWTTPGNFQACVYVFLARDLGGRLSRDKDEEGGIYVVLLDNLGMFHSHGQQRAKNYTLHL